jgi:hypothetical protein
MAVSLSKRPLKERFPEVLKTPRESLPIHYKIEKEGFKYIPYRKEGRKEMETFYFCKKWLDRNSRISFIRIS